MYLTRVYHYKYSFPVHSYLPVLALPVLAQAVPFRKQIAKIKRRITEESGSTLPTPRGILPKSCTYDSEQSPAKGLQREDSLKTNEQLNHSQLGPIELQRRKAASFPSDS